MTTQITDDPRAVARDQMKNGEFHFTVACAERCPQHTEFLVNVGRPVKYDRANDKPQATVFGDHLVGNLMADPRVHLSWTGLASNETVVIMLAHEDVEPDTLRLKGLPMALAEVIQAVINYYR